MSATKPKINEELQAMESFLKYSYSSKIKKKVSLNKVLITFPILSRD